MNKKEIRLLNKKLKSLNFVFDCDRQAIKKNILKIDSILQTLTNIAVIHDFTLENLDLENPDISLKIKIIPLLGKKVY